MFAAMLMEGKVLVATVVAFAGLAALVVYLPVALVREVTRPEGEALPAWMGTVKARRVRMRVVIAVLGLLFLVVGLAVVDVGPNAPPAPPPANGAAGEPSSGSVEALCARVEALPADVRTFELFVPQRLTQDGRPVRHESAMAVVETRLLRRQLIPDGLDQRPTGRIYKYTADSPVLNSLRAKRTIRATFR